MRTLRPAGSARRVASAVGGALALALATLIAPVLPAAVASATPADAASDITWSVAPADEEGADGRGWVERTADPGATLTEHLIVRNLATTEVTFELIAADGYFTDTGRFNMLPRTEESVAAGTWVKVQPTVTLAAHESAVVPYTITVPANATPGDHAAGIAASVYSVGAGAEGAAVGIDSRVGFRVMTRVTGELDPSVQLEQGEAMYDLSWNPFAPGELTVTFEVLNDGNTRTAVAGSVSAAGVSAAFGGADAPERIELLPGDSRTVSVTLPGVWPWGWLSADVRADVQTASDSGSWEAAGPRSLTAGTWGVPLPQLAVLGAVLLFAFAAVSGRRRERTRVAELIAQARRDGARESTAGDISPPPAAR